MEYTQSFILESTFVRTVSSTLVRGYSSMMYCANIATTAVDVTSFVPSDKISIKLDNRLQVLPNNENAIVSSKLGSPFLEELRALRVDCSNLKAIPLTSGSFIDIL